ncbi:MAG: hypothetical protein QM727_08935 [Niabella sp.]
MSNHHKLYNYEVAPPPEAWERIAREMGEIDEYKTVSRKLSDFEVAPPPALWDKIDASLSDENAYQTVSKKLYDLSILPPADTWKKIAQSLEEPAAKKIAPVVPLQKRIIRYVAAACAVTLVALGVFNMIKSSSKDTDWMMNKVAQETKKTDSAVLAKELPKDTPKQTIAQATVPKPEPAYIAANDDDQPVVYSETIEKNKEINGRYIVLMTEDGNVVRMAKKLTNIADCLAGEDENNGCTDQIHKWQKELASATVTSTPDNFLDILALANNEGM